MFFHHQKYSILICREVYIFSDSLYKLIYIFEDIVGLNHKYIDEPSCKLSCLLQKAISAKQIFFSRHNAMHKRLKFTSLRNRAASMNVVGCGSEYCQNPSYKNLHCSIDSDNYSNRSNSQIEPHSNMKELLEEKRHDFLGGCNVIWKWLFRSSRALMMVTYKGERRL